MRIAKFNNKLIFATLFTLAMGAGAFSPVSADQIMGQQVEQNITDKSYIAHKTDIYSNSSKRASRKVLKSLSASSSTLSLKKEIATTPSGIESEGKMTDSSAVPTIRVHRGDKSSASVKMASSKVKIKSGSDTLSISSDDAVISAPSSPSMVLSSASKPVDRSSKVNLDTYSSKLTYEVGEKDKAGCVTVGLEEHSLVGKIVSMLRTDLPQSNPATTSIPFDNRGTGEKTDFDRKNIRISRGEFEEDDDNLLASSSPMGEVRRGENLLLSSLSGGGQITGMAAPTPTSDAKDTDKILHPLGGELKRGANVYVCSEPHTPTLSPKGSR